MIGAHSSTVYRWESMPPAKPFYIEPFQERLIAVVAVIPMSRRLEVGRDLRERLALGTGLHALLALLNVIYG